MSKYIVSMYGITIITRQVLLIFDTSKDNKTILKYSDKLILAWTCDAYWQWLDRSVRH
jgi:hypothetical protein